MTDLVTNLRRVAVCRLCRRELSVEHVKRANGRVVINMKCAKHGVLGPGERYMEGYQVSQVKPDA